MKRFFVRTLFAMLVGLSIVWVCSGIYREKTIVILSTNDIHASIDNFARFAQAVKECRDTVTTVVVDAGDRWTGNAYVDMAEGRRPILDLMNYVGYDVATLGNHEFDCGQKFLGDAIKYANFKVLCANMQVADSLDYLRLPASTIVYAGGVKLLVVGVVTNYDYGHPDGKTESFEGLTFTDPQQSAQDVAEREGSSACGKQRAVRVLLSHMGDVRDVELAARYGGYDLIVSGHTHELVDTVVNGTVIGQTKRKLAYVGATRITTSGRCHVKRIDYRNIPLDGYAEDAVVARMVDSIKHNPTLNAAVGSIPAALDKIGLANMETTLIARATGSEIGFYHFGGIRLTELPEGDVSLATLYNLEPFESGVYTMKMSKKQMQRMILDKFNDKQNLNESHRVDLFSTVPYTIRVDATGDAVAVEMPSLRDGKIYSVAMCDYIAKKYIYEASDVQPQPLLVLDVLVDNLRSAKPLVFTDTPKQSIKPAVK